MNKGIASEILFDLGLDEKGKANKILSGICKSHMEKYVPKDTGVLRDTAVVKDDYVKYVQPYASYVYKGISKSGKPMNYKTPRNWFILGQKNDECRG